MIDLEAIVFLIRLAKSKQFTGIRHAGGCYLALIDDCEVQSVTEGGMKV